MTRVCGAAVGLLVAGLLAACDAEPERSLTVCLEARTEAELVQECSGVNTEGVSIGAGCYVVPRPVTRCLRAKVVNPEWEAWKARSAAAD